MRRAASVCRDPGTSVTHTKNQVCNYMKDSQPGLLGCHYRDAGIPSSVITSTGLTLSRH